MFWFANIPSKVLASVRSMGARQPPEEFALGWTLLGWATALTNRHRVWSTSTMKRRLAAFAIAASLFAPDAHANDALEAKLRAYVPVFSLAKVCDITINDATSDDHRAKSRPASSSTAWRTTASSRGPRARAITPMA